MKKPDSNWWASMVIEVSISAIRTAAGAFFVAGFLWLFTSFRGC